MQSISDTVPGGLVNTHWLSEHLTYPGLVILDATMLNPLPGQHHRLAERIIPGSQRFDIEQRASDTASELPHTLPSASQFRDYIRTLGITHDSVIVIYDNQQLFAAPRAWWLFKVMGFDKVHVLNGGLDAWLKAGLPTAKGYEPTHTPSTVEVRLQPDWLATCQQLEASLGDTAIQLLDARSHDRFYGRVDEPRAGIRRGHIPSAQNLPYNNVLQDGYLLPRAKLRDVFNALQLRANQPLVTSCGSGVTACILALAAYELGFNEIRVYDGSWSQWGGDRRLPVSTD